jgi:hypothetical protein
MEKEKLKIFKSFQIRGVLQAKDFQRKKQQSSLSHLCEEISRRENVVLLTNVR